MKKVLFFWSLFCACLGCWSPDVFKQAKDWYYTPPAPSSATANQIIASLESGDGWVLDGKEWHGFTPDAPLLTLSKPVMEKDEKGKYEVVAHKKVKIAINTVWADVKCENQDCNGSFTFAELRAINKAAHRCQQNLLCGVLNQKSDPTKAN